MYAIDFFTELNLSQQVAVMLNATHIVVILGCFMCDIYAKLGSMDDIKGYGSLLILAACVGVFANSFDALWINWLYNVVMLVYVIIMVVATTNRHSSSHRHSQI